MKYICYKRVSTKKQGLGIEAQNHIVNSFLKEGDTIINSYEEKESGNNPNRPQLLKAIEECKNNDYTLLIAKLDRLSRNVSFISSLMDSKVKFVCCDMPFVDNFVIHVLSALAQKERELISSRTKEAMQTLKRKGVKLGVNKHGEYNMTPEISYMGQEARRKQGRENENKILVKGYAQLLRDKGHTFKEIAEMLNTTKGYRTPSGKIGLFTKSTIHRLLK